MSQHQKILDLLDDGNWHCTSEMREMFMADPPKRLQELGSQVICGGKCTKHKHGGGVKMWRLASKTASYTPLQATIKPAVVHLTKQYLKPDGTYTKPEKVCCVWAGKNGLHSSDCPKREQVRVTNQLF